MAKPLRKKHFRLHPLHLHSEPDSTFILANHFEMGPGTVREDQWRLGEFPFRCGDAFSPHFPELGPALSFSICTGAP